MNNKQGFTLVELLAVIVVLAVILVIAIPNVIKIIDKAKLDVYKRNEDMLVNAAQKYMVSQGISLNNGETKPISYSQLKSEKLIDEINDQTDNNSVTKECSNSKVIVTKTVNGYTYKPGLVCTNYISLETFNKIENYDFNKDENNNNIPDGWDMSGSILKSFKRNEIVFIHTWQWGHISSNTQSVISGRKYYYSARVKASITPMYINFSKIVAPFTSLGTFSYSTLNQYQVMSVIGTANETASDYQLWIQTAAASGWTDVYTSWAILIDLTDIYGTTVPNVSQMDALIAKSR